MKKIFSMVWACLLALSAQATDIKKYDALYENLPFQMEKVTRPQFPANELLATVLLSVPQPLPRLSMR